MKIFKAGKKELSLSLLYSRLLFLLLLVGIFIFGSLVFTTFRNKDKVQKQISDLQAQAAGLQKQREFKDSLLSYLQSDSFVEEQAKQNLSYCKEGEKTVVFVNDIAATTVEATTRTNMTTAANLITDDSQPTRANYWLWWDYFFHNN